MKVRHICNQRLFDSTYKCKEMDGPLPDISIVCHRCSRNAQKRVLVKFKVELPRWIEPIIPEPVTCSNLMCMSRVCDLSLPYTLVDGLETHDMAIKCHCGTVTYISLGGVARV